MKKSFLLVSVIAVSFSIFSVASFPIWANEPGTAAEESPPPMDSPPQGNVPSTEAAGTSAPEWTPDASTAAVVLAEKELAQTNVPATPTTPDDNLSVSLDFKDADIADVLSALSSAYGLNIIAGKDITGKVSVNLTNVTLEDALDAVLSLNQYTYTRNKNIITVIHEGDNLETEVFRLEFAQSGTVKDLFKNVLSEKGDLRLNEQLNELIITDNKEGLEKARELLYRLDVPPPQVIIEAKLVDIDPQEIVNLGADLDFNYELALSDGTHDVNVDYNFGNSSGDNIVASFTSPIFSPANTITLDSLLQKTKANLLSAPRIAVINNQPAKIVIGEKVGIREQTQTASGTIESVRFVDVGITLKVTPQINRGGYVTMEITTEVSSVSSFVDNLPRITTREATTNVRVKDRQTIVIAGLLKEDYTETASSLPLVTHIPLLGQLIGSFTNSHEMKELVIFITPHIMRMGDKIDPKDTEQVETEKVESESVHIKHEQLMTFFRKGGNEDTMDLNPFTPLAEEKNYYDRGRWFEEAARTQYNSRRFRNIKQKYLIEAAASYDQFARQFPDDPRADESMKKAAEIYLTDLDMPKQAYESYRFIASEQPQSSYNKKAVKRLKNLEKELNRVPAASAPISTAAPAVSISAEPIGDLPHAQVPIPSA